MPVTEKKKTTAIKRLEIAKLGYEFTKKIYRRGLEASQTGKPVAWVMWALGAITDPILEAMDVIPIYPENYGAAVAAKRANAPLMEYCEADGFCNVLCGYMRTGLGLARKMAEVGQVPPDDAPLGGMAKPILLLGGSHQCDARFKAFQAFRRYIDVPLYCFDQSGPWVEADHEEMREAYIVYMTAELKGVVAFLEKTLGRKMDWDRLSQCVNTSLETRALWYECYELRKAVPCPMTSPDMWACMVPPFWLSSSPESRDYCQKLYEELKYRVDNNIGAIPHEKYRMLFAELPPWHTLELFDYLADMGAVTVVESFQYYPDPPPDIPSTITNPLERLAWGVFLRYAKSRDKAKKAKGGIGHWYAQKYIDWVREYQCDGAIMHWLLSCHPATIGATHIKRMLLKHAKIPSLVVQSDIVDVRTYSEAEVKHQAEAFIEVMDHYKRVRQKEGMPVAHLI